jgi:ADA HAT complex component 1
MAEELKMLATSPHCAAPGINSLALPQLKRKRSDSSDSATGQDALVVTKLRADDTPGIPVAIEQDSSLTVSGANEEPTSLSDRASEPAKPSNTAHHQSPDPSGSPAAKQDATPRKVNVDKLRDTLEAQLSLEVLLKHNELRLIDQEIAKCQVALEQLRRCAEIPYPGSQTMGQSVSNGTGMAVLTPGNGPPPLSPAPWGVMDGPYTRHYARWLLPDPRFDGGELEPSTPLAFGAPGTPLTEGRSTRGNSGDGGYWTGKSRLPRGSGSLKLQALPNGYPPPKEKAGPMIIRRKSDGVLVKLVCLDCRRDNFSSTQGFINHCRIAHNRNFASHDAAAVASGEPVEVDEAGAVVGGKNEPPSTATAGYVHPLIRSAHVIESSSKSPSASEASGDHATPRKRSASSRQASSVVETPCPSAHLLPSQRNTPVTAKPLDDSFMGSPDTPHLSSLMQLKGVGLDLDRLVGEAKTPIDLGAYSSDEGESDTEPAQPSVDMSHGEKPPEARIGRQPMRTTAPQTGSRRPSSRKGVDKTSHKPLTLETLTPTRAAPYQSPYGPPSSTAHMDELRETDGVDRSANLSPNTVVSNQAPSLVSDDDDYEAASDSDSPGPSSSEAGDHEEDFSHIDVEDDEDTTGSTTTTDPKSDPNITSTAHPSTSLSKPLRRDGSKKKDSLLPASIVSLNRGKDEKRVSFASPDTSPAKGKKDHKRKPSGGQ